MITIEELKRLDADNFGIELSGIELLHTGIPVQELVRFALSKHEEIKRLRTDNAQLQFALRQEVSAYKKAEQEIERLRADLAAANDNHEHMVDEWKAAIREIDRLHAEIEIARSAIGQLYRGRNK